MTKRKPHLRLKRVGSEYHVEEFQEGYVSYRGRISVLGDESSLKYAIIFYEETPALSGPPGRKEHLLDCGEYPLGDKNLSLTNFIDKVARKKAKDLASKLGLPLRVKRR